MIAVSEIVKTYGNIRACDGVSFECVDGTISTLLGANGSGKTTTLRAIAGLARPDSGRVEVDGIEAAKDRLGALARLGVFPESFGLYGRLTAREHVVYSAELHGMGGEDLVNAVDEAIDRLQMRDIADRPTAGFSQGQRMKVALARALVHSPRNLVLDEPTRGLDVMSVRLLRGVLLDLKADGRCIVMSSHVMADVELLSDQVVMIDRGKVIGVGSPPELVERSGQPNLEETFVSLIQKNDPRGDRERNVA